MSHDLHAYDTDLLEFVDAMRYKLVRNAHKGRWEDADLDTMLSRIVEETNELRDAINRGSRIEILLEAADIANFAMIVYHVAIRGGRK